MFTRAAPLSASAASALLAVTMLVGAGSPDTSEGAAEAAPAGVPIECGGYDEDGNVVTPAATRIEHAPAGRDGVPVIPEICGGYTADGTFIGDD